MSEDREGLTQVTARKPPEDDDEKAAHSRFVTRMKNAPESGRGGKITWTRDQLYDEMFE
jgi:hypothetical protein